MHIVTMRKTDVGIEIQIAIEGEVQMVELLAIIRGCDTVREKVLAMVVKHVKPEMLEEFMAKYGGGR